MYRYGLYGFDYTYFIFMIPAIIISLWAQIKVKTTFSKYSKVPNSRGMTGADAAHRVLSYNEVTDVTLQHVSGELTDNFNPKDKTLNLSDPVYSKTSVAAVGVAAHEAGHAVQHAQGYAPMKLRSFLVPAANIGSTLSFPLILVGLILPVQYIYVVYFGIALFSLAVLFQLVTLPVEIDASRRALKTLENSGDLYDEELDGAKKVLKAAAMTYLAATFVALLNLLRILLLVSGRRGND
ncbi:MAG: hypothetical protein RUMPE_00624 [Eubacteriales bacterium SKADARSKE-1]|nr:hypothetical protein [Eubacteriales bacterium SKADARSKE-1]